MTGNSSQNQAAVVTPEGKPSDSQAGTRARLTHLDALRGVAILLVVAFHWMIVVFGTDHLPWRGLTPDFSTARPAMLPFLPCGYGYLGVALFFVLSGFVIHLSTLPRLSAGEPFDARGFFWRRFWRIVPAYYVALFAFALWKKAAAPNLIIHALFLHNLFPRTFFSINPAFWSIATEVQFYALYPLLLLARQRLGMTRTLLLVGALSIVSRIAVALYIPAAGVKGDWHEPEQFMLWYSVPVTWFDWCLGAYAAERYFNGQAPIRISAPVWGLLILAPIVAWLVQPLSVLAFTFASVLSFCALERYARARHTVSRLEKGLIYIGLISYSLYLWHQPLMEPLRSLFAIPFDALKINSPAVYMVVGGVLALGVVVLVSHVSYNLIETRGAKWLQGLFQKKREAIPQTPPATHPANPTAPAAPSQAVSAASSGKVAPFRLLDAWRGIASLGVVCYHWGDIALRRYPDLGTHWLYAASKFGSLGVQLFFVISGYVIAGAALRTLTTGEPVRSYFWARVRRIYPTYWAGLALVVLFLLAGRWLAARGIVQGNIYTNFDLTAQPLSYYLTNLTLTMLPFRVDLMLAVAWTLCYEVAFYAIVGLSLFVAARTKGNAERLLTPLHLLTAGCLLWETFGPRSPFFPLDLWPQFGLGIALFDVVSRRADDPKLPAVRIWAGGLFALTVLFVLVRDVPYGAMEVSSRLQFSVAAVFAAYLCFTHRFDAAWSKNRIVGWLALVGAFSYSLYLTHNVTIRLVSVVMQKLGPLGGESLHYAAYLIALVVAVGAAYVFYLPFEKPLTGGGRKKPKKPDAPPTPTPPPPAVEAPPPVVAAEASPVIAAEAPQPVTDPKPVPPVQEPAL